MHKTSVKRPPTCDKPSMSKINYDYDTAHTYSSSSKLSIFIGGNLLTTVVDWKLSSVLRLRSSCNWNRIGGCYSRFSELPLLRWGFHLLLANIPLRSACAFPCFSNYYHGMGDGILGLLYLMYFRVCICWGNSSKRDSSLCMPQVATKENKNIGDFSHSSNFCTNQR